MAQKSQPIPGRLGRFVDLRRGEQEYPFSRRKLRMFIEDGRLPAYRVDGKILIERASLEDLITSTPVGADLDSIADAAVSEVLSND